MEKSLMKLDINRLKSKFFELLKGIEENKISAIGSFLVNEVEPYMSIPKFADLIKDDIGGYGERNLMKYRKIYKGTMYISTDISDISKHRLELISEIKNPTIKQKFIERANDISLNQFRAEINEYKKEGEMPSEDIKTQIEMNLKYNGVLLKLIAELRELRQAIKQIQEENLFEGFTTQQREKFCSYLKIVKEEYPLLINEIDKSIKHLEE